MSEQAPEGSPRNDDETEVVGGQPGPAGTGEQTGAGADPDAEPAAGPGAQPAAETSS